MQWYSLADTHEYKNIGLPMEMRAQEIIRNAMNVDIIETCNNADYDFKDSNNTTYEVKADTRSHATGNFFITYGQKTLAYAEMQPAGISKSKADYYMMTYGNSFYKIRTDVIRFLAFSKEYQKRTYTNKRNELIQGILVKVSDMKPYATVYDFTD